ncbi:hypothetical protein CJ030_MR0G003838 [Morella rubra]|uniref:Uncharacterized protein n=1 Tax=Morella rubra TaxID=262757 RepID=A0A6A1UNN3_9ROSI|nr:hypothetical protein CJ030_MR0G003838 [Morella rubra]
MSVFDKREGKGRESPNPTEVTLGMGVLVGLSLRVGLWRCKMVKARGGRWSQWWPWRISSGGQRCKKEHASINRACTRHSKASSREKHKQQSSFSPKENGEDDVLRPLAFGLMVLVLNATASTTDDITCADAVKALLPCQFFLVGTGPPTAPPSLTATKVRSLY